MSKEKETKTGPVKKAKSSVVTTLRVVANLPRQAEELRLHAQKLLDLADRLDPTTSILIHKGNVPADVAAAAAAEEQPPLIHDEAQSDIPEAAEAAETTETTVEEVRAAFTAYTEKQGKKKGMTPELARKKAVGILKDKFKVSRIDALKPNQLAEALACVQ